MARLCGNAWGFLFWKRKLAFGLDEVFDEVGKAVGLGEFLFYEDGMHTVFIQHGL